MRRTFGSALAAVAAVLVATVLGVTPTAAAQAAPPPQGPAGDAVLQLRPDDREPGGSYRVKVRWVGSGYAGPVLIRADRIDGTGTALAQFSYTGEARDGGYFATLTESENDIPATTLVSGPGCFAYQLDGTTFSETIVFEVVRAR